MAKGIVDEFADVLEAHLFEDVAFVPFDSPTTQKELLGDFLGTHALGTKLHHFQLARCQHLADVFVGSRGHLINQGHNNLSIVTHTQHDGIDGLVKFFSLNVFADKAVDSLIDKGDDVLWIQVNRDDQHFGLWLLFLEIAQQLRTIASGCLSLPYRADLGRRAVQ